jgi:hypothetical protein
MNWQFWIYTIRFAKKQDSRLRSKQNFEISLRVLANEKPVRFGRSRLQRHTDYETVRPMETTTRMSGFFQSLVKLTPFM